MFLWRDWWVCLAVYIAGELYPRGDSRGYHSTKIPWVWRIWMVKYGNVKDTTSLHPLRKQKIVQDQVSAMPLTTSWRVLRGSGLDVEWDWIITHLRSVYGACSSWRGHRKALIKHYMWQTYTNFVYFYNSLRTHFVYNSIQQHTPICSIQVRLRTNEIEGRGCVKVFVQTMVA